MATKSPTTMFNFTLSVVAILGIEYAFNTYPATGASSMILQLSHVFLLVKIFWTTGVPQITSKENELKKSE
jgi:hypothetical protein